MQNQEIEIVEFVIEDMVKNPVFVEKVKTKIKEIVDKRNARPELKSNERYRRDWYDRINDLGILNTLSFIAYIPLIWQKKSTLNSETRNLILEVCNEACLETLQLDNTKNSENVSSKSKKPIKRKNQ